MCIRDSYIGDSLLHRVQLIVGDAKQNESKVEFNIQKVNYTCLLYTSDAADERSSVDLGGRRIIKKKKHITHEKDR